MAKPATCNSPFVHLFPTPRTKPRYLSTSHLFWLRDHCRCPACFHAVTKQRLVDTYLIPQEIAAKNINLQDNKVQIQWSHQDHVSEYSLEWLRNHSYDPKLNVEASSRKKVVWDRSIASNPPIVQYNEVMSSKEGLRQWLNNIDIYGFSFVDNVPKSKELTEELARKICFVRETHYGGFWDFTANLAHGDTAYTTLPLNCHTDNTYFTDPSGLQMFHLLEFDGKGGESIFVDGLSVAQKLREQQPDSYETLSKIRVVTHSAGDEEVFINPTPRGYPILNHDPMTGELYQIRFNNDDRSTLDYLTTEEVEKFYKALRDWNDILRQPQSEYQIQLEPGRVVVFNNWRVLHGRTSFVGHRRLIGCYLNWDDYNSKLKVLNDEKRV
ncbi:Trimethyllysine dioxygenase [Basidiobolus meristosporus CBS 931.73]|uniref:trimethyllysine dioxygenase n=1 Tax=Basidiobolus meristosporus CBS 931.73 TaxID=1314790 RepID=A0A1Y1YI30_9FUNG|nr:Trimethyllysine dioxygenase [Basidiobolus meristosporus CBS 931.73]|eukprot:ORX97588.1 Trimethyllysine dioxygenase [Basidiobolus meristosporus CBS 931.73]